MTDRSAAAATSQSALTRAWRSAPMRRFRRNKAAVVGLFIVLALVLVAIFAPVLAPVPPDAQNLRGRLQPPGAEHPFGTDEFGRSMLSRVIYGTRVSLFTGLVPVTVALLVGTLIGLVAGFYRGRTDSFLMRIMDVLLDWKSTRLNSSHV